MSAEERAHRSRVWFITGASSGFGQALSEVALQRGDTLVATARDTATLPDWTTQHPERCLTLPVDVTNAVEVDKAVAEAAARFGRIDVVVNNAGYGLVGAVEEASEAEIRDQLEVNLYGVINVTRAVLPAMRQQREGHIVQMSSLNGVQGLPGGGYYAASKFAVEGLSESLADEVAHLGIHVTIVEPGPHRTRFASKRTMEWSTPIEDYEPSAGATRAALIQLDGAQPGDPGKAAQAIAAVVDANAPPRRLPLGRFAVESIQSELDKRRDELEAWMILSMSTDFRGEGHT